MAQYILFLDTNVFLDALLKRYAGKDCEQILNLTEEGVIEAHTSSSCILTIIYFLQKAGIPVKVVKDTIKDLLDFVSLISANKKEITEAIRTDFPDIEDAVQYQTALQIKGIDYFITSNIKDFKKAVVDLPVLSPKDFINLNNR